jgi:hypothetical protein
MILIMKNKFANKFNNDHYLYLPNTKVYPRCAIIPKNAPTLQKAKVVAASFLKAAAVNAPAAIPMIES